MKIIKNILQFGLGHLLQNKESKVIYYHDISNSEVSYTPMSTPLQVFKDHIKVIKTLGFEIVEEISENYNQIKICLDDGFKGIYTNKAFFIENNIPVEIFVITSFIGQPGYLSANEITELNRRNIFKFGAHTHTHRNLIDLSNEDVFQELFQSKRELEILLNQQIDAICYPRGLFNNTVLEISRQLKFDKLYSSIPGSYFEKSFKGVIYRNLVQSSDARIFEAILLGGSTIFQKRHLKQHFSETF